MTLVSESVVPAVVFYDGIKPGRRRRKEGEEVRGRKGRGRKVKVNMTIPAYTAHTY